MGTAFDLAADAKPSIILRVDDRTVSHVETRYSFSASFSHVAKAYRRSADHFASYGSRS